ncbi:MAG: C-GCAxxG-C-C family protein [Methanomassiliicoccales archaeon]
MERKDILARVRELAYHYESSYRGCAQSSLAALQDVFDIRDDGAFRSASGLAGGVGLSNLGSCGALSGGSMAIGMLFGRERERFDDPERRRKVAYQLCKRLVDRFVEEYGSVVCADIQKVHLGREYDLWDGEEYTEFDRVAYQGEKCPDLVAKASVWAAEIILDELQDGT